MRAVLCMPAVDVSGSSNKHVTPSATNKQAGSELRSKAMFGCRYDVKYAVTSKRQLTSSSQVM